MGKMDKLIQRLLRKPKDFTFGGIMAGPYGNSMRHAVMQQKRLLLKC